MKYRSVIRLYCSFIILISTQHLNAQNSITLINPPTSVSTNEIVTVTVNYDNTGSIDAYVLVRFKSPTGDNLGQDFKQVSPGQGTETLDVPAPATSGTGYSYQAQLLETGTWAGLAEDNISGVTVGSSNTNSITLVNPPTTVSSNDVVDVTVNYNNIGSIDAYVLVRFKNSAGDNLGQDFSQVSPGQGTETLQVPTPATSGGGYSYQAQLLETGTWAGLAEDNISNITVDPSNNNSLTLNSPPTIVTSNTQVTVSVDYNNTGTIDAYVLVRFKSPTGDNLEQAFTQVSPGQGTESLQVTAPANMGSGYSYQAQLLETGTWAGLAEDIVNNVTVEHNSSGDIVTLTSWPDIIVLGGTYSISVDYTVTQNSIIYTQIFDRESPDGSGNWNKIGEAWVNANVGIGSTTINDILIDLDVASSNRLEVLLFHPSDGSWGDPVPIGNVFVNVPGESGIIFGEPAASDPSTYMRYYDRNLECNGNTYNGNDVGNGSGVDHTLAPTTNIYRSNWWVNAEWKGPIKSHYGENEQNGKNFWVEWTNLGQCGSGHAEFDIRVEKSNVSDNAVEAGFPSRLGDITAPLDCTFSGNWTAGSKGRGHINMTTWVYNTLDLIPDNTATRCDIIIHAWDNSGDFRKKYEDGFRWSLPGTNTIFHFDKIGTATANGITYEVLRTMPGGFGEGASYNLVPSNWPREFATEFPTNTIYATIDVNKILKDIIVLEAANGPDIVTQQDGSSYQANLLTEDWGLHVMEWTVTGQSGTYEHDPAFPDDFDQKVFIPNSQGRFTFNDYFIPNPCCSNPSLSCDPILDCNVPLASASDNFTRFNTSDLSTIESSIQSEMANEQMLGLSVGIIRNGEVAHLSGYGLADQTTGARATQQSMYRLASVSKTVTSVLALQLREQGLLDFDDDIRDYVPEYPVKPQGIITSEDLLSNESGIMHYSGNATCGESFNTAARDNYIANHTNHHDPVEAINMFRDQSICFQPGQSYQYSTWGFCLIGAVIERATPKSFQELLFDNIVCPLDLPSLQIEYQDRRPYPNEVTGYEVVGGVFQPASASIDLTDISYKVGGGGLIGSVVDLSLFMKGIVNAELFSTATRDFMGTVHTPNDGISNNYGYGTWSGIRNGDILYWHSGSQSKTATLIYYSPENKNGVALMCNTKNVSLFPLARLIYDFLPSTTLSGPAYSGPDAVWNHSGVIDPGMYESSHTIRSNGTTNTSDVILRAKKVVELNGGFTVTPGTNFEALADDGCY